MSERDKKHNMDVNITYKDITLGPIYIKKEDIKKKFINIFMPIILTNQRKHFLKNTASKCNTRRKMRKTKFFFPKTKYILSILELLLIINKYTLSESINLFSFIK